MKSVFEMLGMVGIGLSVLAYLPQSDPPRQGTLLGRVSTRAWRMWLASSLLVGSPALYRHDYVFIALSASSLGASATTSSLPGPIGGGDAQATQRASTNQLSG